MKKASNGSNIVSGVTYGVANEMLSLNRNPE
jgi:hypothetical protein